MIFSFKKQKHLEEKILWVGICSHRGRAGASNKDRCEWEKKFIQKEWKLVQVTNRREIVCKDVGACDVDLGKLRSECDELVQ
jgi:hypothetical protein